MATTSITKDFYVNDLEAFERLKFELDSRPSRQQVVKPSVLKVSKEKLDAFYFMKTDE